MSAFTSNVSIYPYMAADTGKWAWAVGAPLVWEIRGATMVFPVVVPVGFSTDLGSVPWFARMLFNPADPQCAKPWILHDFLLEEFGKTCQPLAASQLYEAMRSVGVPIWSRKLQVAGVIAGIDDW